MVVEHEFHTNRWIQVVFRLYSKNQTVLDWSRYARNACLQRVARPIAVAGMRGAQLASLPQTTCNFTSSYLDKSS